MDMVRLYQLKDTPENADFLYKPYEYVISHGGLVHESRYNKVYEGALLTEMSATAVRDSIKNKPRRAFSKRAPGTGDVITMEHTGMIECYYLDPYGMVPLNGFFTEPSRMLLTPSTTEYVLSGKPGLWQVADAVTVENTTFFLLESMEYGRQAAGIITDAEGHILTDDNTNDFDDAAIAMIRRWLHPEEKTIIISKQPHGKQEQAAGERESVRKRLKEKLAKVHGDPPISDERL